jgi:hypothetical protein
MANYSLHSDFVNHVIEIRDGFKVDYSPEISSWEKDYNNNGVWGKIINRGTVVKSINWNPYRCEPNFGRSDYEVKKAEMFFDMLSMNS